MPTVILLSYILMNVILPRVIMPRVILPSVILPIVILLSIVLLCVSHLSFILQKAILLNFNLSSVIMLIVSCSEAF